MYKSKHIQSVTEQIDRTAFYSLGDAIALLKELSFVKFDETMEIHMNLGVEPRHADQNIRVTTTLPHGTGKEVRVLVVTAGPKEKEAEEAGADYVGKEYLEKIKAGWTDVDKIIATPDMMADLGRMGKILGPRGLMPNPKSGTVTMDIAKAVKEIKAGKIELRVDKTGIIHAPCGKVSFEQEALEENVREIYNTIMKAKPASVKGTYLKKMSLSTTMGPGLKIDHSTLR
ncbi:MAG: 50S ribosomal protein L1 [FCB group bacterium]|nr:50S ribosomal protein L1 [FCB group bacterium]